MAGWSAPGYGAAARQTTSTHSKGVGFVLWIFGFTGSHRFYFGKPVSGTIWFFTLGLLGIGWLFDVFFIPSMNRKAARRFVAGPVLDVVGRKLIGNPEHGGELLHEEF